MRLNDSVTLVASGDLSLSMTHPSDGNAYLVDCGGASLLIDTGVGLASREIAENIDRALKAPLTHILVTHHHADHTGGLCFLKERYGAAVAAPAREADSIEQADEAVLGLDVARKAGYYPADYRFEGCEVDVRVNPGDALEIGAQTIEVCDGAGHSLGGVCYWLPGLRALFVGDLLAHGGVISLQNIPGANLAAYSQSVQGLEGLDVEQFYPGHGCFSLKDGKRHIAKAAGCFRGLGVPPNAV